MIQIGTLFHVQWYLFIHIERCNICRCWRYHLRQCLREARVGGILYLSGLAWTLVVVIGWGYVPVEERPAVPELILGMPAWVVWGLFVPWFLQIAAAWWFALRVLADEDPDQLLDDAAGPEVVA